LSHGFDNNPGGSSKSQLLKSILFLAYFSWSIEN
jgi:hypothetical protein